MTKFIEVMLILFDRSFLTDKLNFSSIYLYLMEKVSNYPSRAKITPPSIRKNSIAMYSSSNPFEEGIVGSDLFTSEDRELIYILDD